MLSTILVMAALILFIIAGAWNPPPDNPWRSRLVCFGLACWVAGDLLRGVGPPMH